MRVFPVWFRKRSVYHLRIFWGVVIEMRFPVSASAKVSVNQSVVLDSCLRKIARSLEECVGFSHISSVTRSQDFRKVRMRSVDRSGTD